MRIGLGLSVCDKCGSVVYQPTTTTTTTTAAPPAESTTLYLTDTENAFGTDLSTTHDEVTFASVDGSVELFNCLQPFNTATWGTWGGEVKIKVVGTLTDENFSVYLLRMPIDFSMVYKSLTLGPLAAGINTISIPSTDWDDIAEGGVASDSDVFIFSTGSEGTPVETDSFTIDCTNPTDTYLTLDAELDPQPWPATTTTTT